MSGIFYEDDYEDYYHKETDEEKYNRECCSCVRDMLSDYEHHQRAKADTEACFKKLNELKAEWPSGLETIGEFVEYEFPELSEEGRGGYVDYFYCTKNSHYLVKLLFQNNGLGTSWSKWMRDIATISTIKSPGIEEVFIYVIRIFDGEVKEIKMDSLQGTELEKAKEDFVKRMKEVAFDIFCDRGYCYNFDTCDDCDFFELCADQCDGWKNGVCNCCKHWSYCSEKHASELPTL